MGATGQMMDSENIEDLTRFRITVITSSSGLRVLSCRSSWKEDSKTYIPRMKTHKYGACINFYQKITPTLNPIGVYIKCPQLKTPDCDPGRSSETWKS